MPPVVRRNVRVVDGQNYDWELICGNHRVEALSTCGYEEWIFDVYEFALNGLSFEDSVRTFQLQENDHEPQLESSQDDVVNVISRLIKHGSRLVDNSEKSIANYVSTFLPNVHWQTQSKIVRSVVAANGSYQDIVTYTRDDVKRWLYQNTSYKNEGEYDKHRDAYGWSCLSRYEHEVVFNMIKKFSETKKKSYVIAHTSAPTKDRDLHSKRVDIFENFRKIEESLVDMIHFYNEHKSFPWHLEGYLPQDRQKPEDEKQLVKIQ
jgi:hypothetical protein